MTLEEVQKDVELQERQVQLVSKEVERLKQQLASEKKNVSDTSMELQVLKLELVKSKNEAEHLKLMERNFEERRYTRSKSRLELEDANNTIVELKEELAYKSSVNRSLGLQLEKTIESNSELLLEIKDLDDVLQSKEREIEELKAELEEGKNNQELEDEKAIWLLRLEESEQERRELEKKLLMLEATRGYGVSDGGIQELREDNEMLRKEIEKAETEFANTSKENMNLLSQLMDLRHQTNEKSTLVQELEQRLAMVQDQSSLEVEALQMKAKDLQMTVSDLKDKLHLSEQLSQSQLESNKVFMEDLISTVEGLRARNEQLEASLKSSEEKHSGLLEELEAREKELLAHAKEQSLLVSQRGQLKILREKIATLTEDYEIAMERGEDLELAIKALKEEHCKALCSLDEQLKQLEEKLHDANAESMALKAELEKAESQAAETDEQTNLLLVAKEAAEANSNSLDAAYSELQKQYDSLLVAKEKTDASLCSLQAAHTELQEHLKDAEYHGDEAIHQLQERDIRIIELTEALSSAENQLKRTREKTSKLEATIAALQEELQHMQDEKKRLQTGHIEDFELELARMKESLIESSKSLSASEDKVENLQLQNSNLSEMLHSETSKLEATIAALEEELQHMQDEKRLQTGHIEDFELELARMKESLTESSKSLSASEDKVQNLQLQNSDLSEMLHSAVSYKEDVVSRLETALARELELEKKLQETQQALESLKSEKVTSDRTIEELQERICLLKDERAGSVKGKDEDRDVRELHKILRTQVEVLKNSMREMKLEKEKAESSLQKMQAANTSLGQELKKWKEKVKAGTEELALWKEKIKTSKRLSTSSEDKTSQSPDSNMKGAKKSTDLDQKSKLLKIHKQAADMRRKLLEQEEEKEDMKKKLLSYQKEVQRKSELVNLTEKRLKEKEREQRAGQRPPSRHASCANRRIGMADSNMPYGGKTTVDLIERVKSLEAELNIKTVELEATQFLLKEKEAGGPDSNVDLEKDETMEGHVNTNKPEHLQTQSPKAEQHGLLTDFGSQETLQDEVQRLQVENRRLKNLPPENKEETAKLGDEFTSDGVNRDSLQREKEDEHELCAEKTMKGTHLQEELREMKERYSQMSLQFAELQVEKDELLVTIRNLSRDSYNR